MPRPDSDQVLARLRDSKELQYVVIAQMQGMGLYEERVIRILKSKPEFAGVSWDEDGKVMAEARIFARTVLQKAIAVSRVNNLLKNDHQLSIQVQRHFLRFKDDDVNDSPHHIGEL